MRLLHRLRGQTLIELLIASAVIATGLFASATLVFSNLQLSDRDADEIVVVNLAREGIELAKQVRDSNWIKGIPFDSGLVDATSDYTAIPVWDGGPASPDVTFSFLPSAIGDTQTIVRRSTNAATPEFFTQSDPGAIATPWRRLLIFHPICDTGGSVFTYLDDGAVCALNQKVGIRVESRIQWTRKGQTLTRSFYEDLFDWR